uniref:IU_nuc_hydro domain-containing protein n=1 Tax=Pristionchus pacificus TaxID=54126 RepID=A0A2A6BB89_PRIPA|eukprot:PDM63143.1 hypothetical protein PRIPAC_50358 [Pristionchus pacificus]
MSSKRKLIIDTDGVADDIRAVSLALQHPDVEVLAITTTHGCVKTEQAAANVARALRANGVKVPIYKGATTQSTPVKENTWDESVFFGKDGIGGQPTAFPEVLESDFSCWETEHAAQALIRLTREHENVTVVAIGCLTNLALALKLDDDFKRKLEGVVIMGGNYYG